MKTERNILIAFILNLSFSVAEFIGGILTGSVAIISDAIHDVCDAVCIGFSFIFEEKSKKQPDEIYTYGYSRYSVIGGFVTTFVLVISSVVIIFNSINRIINPTEINYNGMIFFAIVGVCVNFCVVMFTRGKGSLNQKAVNLHMIEDVLGWFVVLIGAVIMKFTDFAIIDAIMSSGVSAFILFNAIGHLKKILVLFLDKIPDNIEIEDIKSSIYEVDGVIDVHHIHIRSLDGQLNLASLHVVTDEDACKIKENVRNSLREKGVSHITIEIENSSEICNDNNCHPGINSCGGHCHHNH